MILIVLVAVAIMMLLYFAQMETLFGPGLPSERAGIQEHPWVLEELLIPDGQEIKLPRRPKLKLEEPFSITAPVNRNEAERGEVAVAFNTDGRIVANWQPLVLDRKRPIYKNALGRNHRHCRRKRKRLVHGMDWPRSHH
ncbi:MAG: hypothetical protein ACYSO0_06220 [Planctomycetota bacterium]